MMAWYSSIFVPQNNSLFTIMSIIKKTKDVWGPWPDFFDTDRFFTDIWPTKMQSAPSVNIKETDGNFTIEMAAAGMDKDDFKISLDDNALTISGERKEEKKEENEKYTRREFSYNSFSRTFVLPENSNAEKIAANYENGLLKIELPKKEQDNNKKTKEISIS